MSTGLRRAAPLLLLAALAGAYAAIAPHLPHDHDVVFELGDSARDLADLEVSWVDIERTGDEADLTTHWRFAPGTAPRNLRARVHLASRRFRVLAALERQDGTRSEVERRVDLDRGTVVIHLEHALASSAKAAP